MLQAYIFFNIFLSKCYHNSICEPVILRRYLFCGGKKKNLDVVREIAEAVLVYSIYGWVERIILWWHCFKCLKA